MDESLADLRKQIDALDSQLSEMLAARLEVSRKVSAAKKDNSQVFRPAREAQLLGKLLTAAPASLQQLIPVVWRAIISSSIAEQRPDFTILASPQMGVEATAFAAGQLGVKNVENLDTALAELIDKQADILLVSTEELCRIAGNLGPDRPAMVIACLPLVMPEQDSTLPGALFHARITGWIIGRPPAEQTDFDSGVFYLSDGNKIEIAELSRYENMSGAELLGVCPVQYAEPSIKG